MSYANGTAHFNLPQTVGTDKRDWSDTNEAFAKLDAAVEANTQSNTAAAENITVLQNEVKQNTNDISSHATQISAVQNDITEMKSNIANNSTNISNNTASINDVRQDNEDMICAYNEPSATSKHYYAVGDYFIYNNTLYKATQIINVDSTILPNTNCETTNVSTELLNVQGTGNVRTALEDMITLYNEGRDEISNHDYAVGDYFIYQDVLYKATQAIPTGMTITAGTNCVQASVTNRLENLPYECVSFPYILSLTTGVYSGKTDIQPALILDNTNNKYHSVTLNSLANIALFQVRTFSVSSLNSSGEALDNITLLELYNGAEHTGGITVDLTKDVYKGQIIMFSVNATDTRRGMIITFTDLS